MERIKQIDGQLTFEMCLSAGNYVVQANDLINGRQALSLNESKLIRMAIMQITKDDKDFKPYVIKVKEIAELLNISESNIYRDIEEICRGIIKKPVELKVNLKEKKITKWVAIPWVSRCEYDTGTGKIYLKLNEELRPYLLNLKEHYTQYTLDNILAIKSVYAIRIFELLQKECKLRILPKEGVNLKLSLEDIRECCDLYYRDEKDNITSNKYEQFGMLKKKVIDVAVKEIERVTMYSLTYDYIKKSRTVTGFNFHLNMKYH